MEKDFHYHLTYAAAKFTGLADPEIVAYSCQFVDDNNEGQFSEASTGLRHQLHFAKVRYSGS